MKTTILASVVAGVVATGCAQMSGMGAGWTTLIDGEKGKAMLAAPQAERFDVAHLRRVGVVETAHDDALVAVEDFAPALIAGRLLEHRRDGPRCGDRPLITGGPQTDTASGLLDLGAVHGNAQIRIRGQHGRTPFLRRKCNS